jgi:hypothetical protein
MVIDKHVFNNETNNNSTAVTNQFTNTATGG